MNKKIKILHLEDLNSDAGLITNVLTNGKLDFERLVVDTKAKLIKSLTAFSPDIILLDPFLPSVDFYDILVILNGPGMEIPFILVTDVIPGQLAVDAIKKGAADYITKDRLSLLPTAIHISLEKSALEKKRKIILTGLTKNERHYHALIDNNSDGIMILSAENKVIYASPSMNKILGFSAEEITELDLFTITHPEDILTRAKIIKEVMAKPGITVEGHCGRMRHKNGTWRSVEETVTNLLHDPSIKGMLSNLKDVTARKESAEKIMHDEQKFRMLIENSIDGMAILSAAGKPIYVSPAIKNVLGYSDQEAMELDLFSLSHPGDTSTMISAMERAMANPGIPVKADAARMRHKDGNWRWIEGIITNMLNYPAINGIVNNFRDITERVRAEEKIMHLNRLYAFTSQINQTIVHAADEQIVFKEACRIAIEIGNFKAAWIGIIEPAEQKIKLVGEAGLQPGDMALFSNISYQNKGPQYYVLNTDTYYICNDIQQDPELNNWKAFASDRCYGSAMILPIRKSGILIGTFNLYASDINFFNRDEIALLEEVATDISFALDIFEKEKQRAHAKQKLKLNEARLKQAQAIAHVGSWDLDFSTGVSIWSEEALRIYGLPPEECNQSRQSWESFIHPEDINYVKRVTSEAVSTLNNIAYFHRIVKRDGTIRHLYTQARVEFNGAGEPKGLNGVVHDVTEIRDAEEALRESESNLQAIFKNTTEGFVLADKSGIVKSFNNKSRDIIFLNTKREIRVGQSIFDFIDESRKKNYKNAIAKVLNGEPLQYDYSYERKNGEIKWFNFTINPVHSAGQIEGLCITSADITERKEAEQLLRQSEVRYRQIVETAQEGIWLTDENNRTTFVNKKMCEILEYSEEEMMGKENFYFMGEAGKPIAMEMVERRKNGLKENIDMRFITKSGKNIWTTISANPIFDDHAKYKGALGMVSDITEKKNLENLLHKTNNLARIGSWEIDMLNSGLFWSPVTKEIHGVNVDFIPDIDTALGFYQAGTGRNSISHAIKEAIEKGTAFDLELQIIPSNQTERWVRVVGEAEFINGKCIRLYGSLQDIHKRKKAEIEVLKIYEEKNIILESIGDGFYAMDKNWDFTYWNKEAEILLGKKREEVLGKNIWDVYPDTIDTDAYINYHKAVKENTIQHYQRFNETLQRWAEVSAYPSANGLSVYFRDITESKLLEINLNELNEKLQKHARDLAVSNKELEDFAFIASHDLQEPLRMVTGFLAQIDKKYSDIIDDKGKQYIYFAVDGARRMRQIILDLLEFSRVGRMQDKEEEVDLNEVVREVIMLCQNQITETHAVINFENLPRLKTFKAPLRQVFQNLVSNALKYQKEQQPAIIHIAAKETPTHWQLSVKDNGIGIEAEYFNKIFIIFQRLHNKDEYSGTGIGLAICKKIVENMGGEIRVASEDGNGSTFYFTLLKKL